MKNPKLFSDSYQLTLTLFHRTKNFPKQMRPTVGRRLEESSVDLLLSVKLASISKGKSRVQKLRTASQKLDEIRLLVQLSKDTKILSSGSFGEISSLTSEIGKEIGGFLKYESQKLYTPSK